MLKHVMLYITTAVFLSHAFRSSSSSDSRDSSQRRKCKHGSKEESAVKDNRCGRSLSKSPSELCCEDGSRDPNYLSASKSHPRSRSRSRERRKDKKRQSASNSRHKGEPKSNPNRRLRSRSRSRERREEEGLSKSSEKPPGFCDPYSKNVKQVQTKKKEDIVLNFPKEDTTVKTQEAQRKDLSTNSQTTTPATHEERALLKEIKKEKPPTFDMFESELASTKAEIKEESDISGLIMVKKEEEYKGFKTEACEISRMKSEAGSPEFCPSVTLLSPLLKPGGLQDQLGQLQPALPASAAQPDTAELTVGIKQEIQQASESDDDFNVDVMLDNLQYEKPEHTGERVSDQQENEAAAEGETVSVLKSKNPVKRVTWNIQEPEGPQPEKSPSSKCGQVFISYIKKCVFVFVVF